VWSFQDNLEWASGYEMHFGLIWIERPSLERIVKNSLKWYSSVINLFQSTAQKTIETVTGKK
jgi:beta-glucosidase